MPKFANNFDPDRTPENAASDQDPYSSPLTYKYNTNIVNTPLKYCHNGKGVALLYK